MIIVSRGSAGPIVCSVETEPSKRWTSFPQVRPAPRLSREAGGPGRPDRRRNRPRVGADGSPAHRGEKLRGITGEPGPQRVTRLDLAHLGAVLAPGGLVQRHRGLVGSTAVRAVPLSKNGLHKAPVARASDFNLDAMRWSFRPSASPQSVDSDRFAVVLPFNAMAFVVQCRRTLPARDRAEGASARAAQPAQVLSPTSRATVSTDCPHVSHFGCRSSVPMRHPLSSPRPAAGTRLSWGIGPSEGIGAQRLPRIRKRPRRSRSWRSQTAGCRRGSSGSTARVERAPECRRARRGLPGPPRRAG